MLVEAEVVVVVEVGVDPCELHPASAATARAQQTARTRRAPSRGGRRLLTGAACPALRPGAGRGGVKGSNVAAPLGEVAGPFARSPTRPLQSILASLLAET